MKIKTVYLYNSFHNSTSGNIRAEILTDGALHISEGQSRKAAKQVCGMDGCSCGQFEEWRYDEGDFQYSAFSVEPEYTRRGEDDGLTLRQEG
uniref:Uncharacterized protein n=1 Tax=viral metagenome TaxID=1070528 RepID=A0A6H1Z906_9ZZZZ